MWRQAVGASIVTTLLALSGPVLGQQLNPFTAMLTEPVARTPLKAGRKRVTLKEVNISTTAESAKQSGRSSRSHSKSTKDQKQSTTKPPSSKSETKSDTTTPSDTVTLMPEESDLRRNIGVKYQILTEVGSQLRTDDPNRVYHSGEAFRLKIEANINANLYLLAEDSRTGERRLLFPNYKYQRGAEQVKPFTPIVVPPLGQPAFAFDSAPGEERIVVICSRDEIPALQLAPVEELPAAIKLVASRSLPPDLERSIGEQDELGARDFVWVSQQPPGTAKTGTAKTGEAGVYVVNTSKKDNEEVVYVIRLKHGD